MGVGRDCSPGGGGLTAMCIGAGMGKGVLKNEEKSADQITLKSLKVWHPQKGKLARVFTPVFRLPQVQSQALSATGMLSSGRVMGQSMSCANRKGIRCHPSMVFWGC